MLAPPPPAPASNSALYGGRSTCPEATTITKMAQTRNHSQTWMSQCCGLNPKELGTTGPRSVPPRNSGHPPPKRNCFRLVFVTLPVRGRETPLVDIEMCTPHRARQRAAAPHPPMGAPRHNHGHRRGTPHLSGRQLGSNSHPQPLLRETRSLPALRKGPDASRRSNPRSLRCETHTRLQAAALLNHCPPPPPPPHTHTHTGGERCTNGHSGSRARLVTGREPGHSVQL